MGDEEEYYEEPVQDMNQYGDEVDDGNEEDSGGFGICGCCIGVVLFPLALVLLGWNEQNFVCTSKKILFVEDKVAAGKQDCTGTNDLPKDKVMFFSCPVDEGSLETWSRDNFTNNCLTGNDTSTWKGIQARRTAELFGCKESVRTQNNRKIYSYRKEWMTSDEWKRPTQCTTARLSQNCGASACLSPPTCLGKFASKTAEKIKAGRWEITKDRLESASGIDETAVEFMDYFPATCESSPRVGCFKQEYRSVKANYMSAIAIPGDSTGALKPVTVPGSFACGKDDYLPVRGGDAELTPEKMISNLNDQQSSIVMILRIVGILLSIIGMQFCLLPIAEAAEAVSDVLSYIPCVGEFMGDTLQGIVGFALCAISCTVGISCSMLVIGIAYVVLRPLLGLGLIGGTLVCCAVAVGVSKMTDRKPKKKKGAGATGAPATEMPPMQAGMMQPGMMQPGGYGAAPYGAAPYGAAPYGAAPMAQPMMQQQTYTITVPPGHGPGAQVPFYTTDGRQLMATVPDGFYEGSMFQIVA